MGTRSEKMPSTNREWQSNHYYCYGYGEYIEKRQLFLRSYQFSRKRSLSERIHRSVRRVKKVVWLRLRSARRLRRVVWYRLRSAFFHRRRRFFFRLRHEPSYCF
ncbi:PREDICTED: uncharacterized protein LOC104802768 [Tarenaya hassleriana]|uniref:uncharacterized protein LOC104802768 n=1 Tax=Tarenaya hassleriana TaxID=28532 RepID=UPI00053CA503|nr:PREDICTED: uncharacterized protein LOC104802768 [Tarenaya hassleriana]